MSFATCIVVFCVLFAFGKLGMTTRTSAFCLGEGSRSVFFWEKMSVSCLSHASRPVLEVKISASCLSHASRPVLEVKMSASCWSHAPRPVLLGGRCLRLV